MTTIKLSDLLRFNASVLVSDAEMSNIHRDAVLREARKNLAEEVIHRIVHDCVESSPGYMGYSSNLLTVDVFVITPSQLHQLMAKAREDGMKDVYRFQPTEYIPL